MIIALSVLLPVREVGAIDCVFRNPIIARGQDPSVVQHEGNYYLVQSNAGQLTIAKASTLTGLGSARPVPVFAPLPGETYSYDMWAPELVYLDGGWYIYVAATSAPGDNATHRMYVLEADTADPQGTWTMRGKVYDPAADKWAIDGTVFEYDDQLYMVWSGWPGDTGDFPQNLYIAEMSDPLTLSSERHLISEPDQPWENSIAAIQEGPEAFIHEGQLSIVYSADASWNRAYKLGLLKLVADDPLDAESWEKIGPVFSAYEDDDGATYGPGHNSMPVLSPDGSEYWQIYHAKTVARDGWQDRAIFIQPFTWNDDNTPNFGRPLPAGTPLALPSGEACGLVSDPAQIVTGDAADAYTDGVFELTDTFVDTGTSWVNTLANFSIAVSVRLDQTDTPSTMISQNGGSSSHFALEYNGETFAFTLFDAFAENPVSVTATFTPDADKWYQLVGVRDARTGELHLYVDGELQGTAFFDQDWAARGPTILGAARKASEYINLLSGTIRDVRIYNGALSAEEVAALP